jgi:hypothetical protein
MDDDQVIKRDEDDDEDEDNEESGDELEGDIPADNTNPTSSPNGEDPDGV